MSNEQQHNLFSRHSDEVNSATEEGIAKVERGTDPHWKFRAMVELYYICEVFQEFTSDNVWWRMEDMGMKAPREPSAMGPIMRMGKSMGWMESTNITKESDRPTRHRTPQRVWRSLIYRGR
jgi:hypothetical protein